MATHRLLLESLPVSPSVSRLRAEGKITADMTSVWIGFSDQSRLAMPLREVLLLVVCPQLGRIQVHTYFLAVLHGEAHAFELSPSKLKAPSGTMRDTRCRAVD
jgi:hypothetical protein